MKNENIPKGPGRAMRGGAKAKDFKKSIKQLIIFLRPYLLPILVSIIFTIVACILSIFHPPTETEISQEST